MLIEHERGRGKAAAEADFHHEALLVLLQNEGFCNPNPFPSGPASLPAVGRDYYLIAWGVATPTPKRQGGHTRPTPTEVVVNARSSMIRRAWKSLREIDPNPRSRPRNPD